MDIKKQTLVFDIETHTYYENKADPDKDYLKYVGFRFPNGKKVVYHANSSHAIQNILSRYPYVAGHNIKGYDVPIMERYGFKFNYNSKRSVMIDTYEIIKKRAKTMMYLDFGMGQMSLDYLTRFFGLNDGVHKGSFDYKKLRKPFMSEKDFIELKEYLFVDLDLSYSLFEYLHDFFIGLSELMSPSDRFNAKWLTTSSGSNAYKIICYKAGLPEVYDDSKSGGIKFEGGWVIKPAGRFFSGRILVFDFASLYPNMFIGGNLYSESASSDVWVPSGVYSDEGLKGDRIIGKYSKTQGKIEKVIKNLLVTRLNFKDEVKGLSGREKSYKKALILAIKIVINTMYGISGSPIFKSVYSKTTPRDCTAMARKSNKHAKQVFERYGFEVLYGDTDSLYIRVPSFNFNDPEMVAEEITKEQVKSFNISTDTHRFELEDEIKKMFFFLDDNGRLLKKKYAYVTEEDEVVVKGIGVVRGDCSEVSKRVFEKFIKPDLLKASCEVEYGVEELLGFIKSVALEDSGLITKRFRVKSLKEYSNTTSIQAQISLLYGAGEHYLVCNKVVGAGKSKKYAKVDELKKMFGDKWLDFVVYSPYISDLGEFVRVSDRKLVRRY